MDVFMEVEYIMYSTFGSYRFAQKLETNVVLLAEYRL